MYIYNITTKVHTSIHEAWVEWMKMHHIPQIMATGCFTESQFVRLLELDDSEGPTLPPNSKRLQKQTITDILKFTPQHYVRILCQNGEKKSLDLGL